MDVVSACPLRVGSVVWRPRDGVFVLTFVCKATFTLLPVESTLARDQDPPNEADDHWDDDARRSLHGAGDLAPFKPRADVFLVGHAHAPRGQPVSSLTARMIVGDVDKSIEVHADRVWTQDGQLREGARFTKMPLLYERAGGGPMTSNPVGMRPDAQPDRYGQVPVPNLQPPGHHVARPDDAIPPVGLGPIAPTWPGRAARLYGHAATWDRRVGPAWSLPPGIDPGFFNAAPPDQQIADLRGDERLVLDHLHADHPRLVTNLPGIVPQASVERPGGAPLPQALRCDTLGIDTDRGVCHLVWRGQLMLSRPDEAGRVVIAMAGERAPEARATPSPVRSGRLSAVTLVGGRVSAAAVLPFAPQDLGEDEAATLPPGRVAPGLPFREGPTDEPPAPPERPRGRQQTLVVMRGASKDVLPFVEPAREAAPPPADPPSALPPPPPLFDRAEGTPWAVSPSAPPSPSSPPSSSIPPIPASPSIPPPAPPMIGPLATPERVAEAPPPAGDGAPEGEPVPASEAAPTVTAAPAEPLPLPLARYPLERCASIAAAIARTAPEKDRILEAHDLDPATWTALDAHWNDTVRAQAARGRTAQLRAYDEAYVAQLEKERGPISAAEYARILVAQERDAADETLAAMTLPRSALLRIQRVWMGRVMTDAELGKNVRRAVDAAREAD